MMILQPRSKNPRELLLRAAVFVVLSLFSVMRHADAASSPQTPAQSGEVQVFASADESSPVIESAADGKSLLPIAEMTGAGGLKWFMVKTRNGNVGWIKAGDKMGAAKIDDHFRSLPKDSSLVGPTSGWRSPYRPRQRRAPLRFPSRSTVPRLSCRLRSKTETAVQRVIWRWIRVPPKPWYRSGSPGTSGCSRWAHKKESESAVLSTWMSAWSRPSEWAELK